MEMLNRAIDGAALFKDMMHKVEAGAAPAAPTDPAAARLAELSAEVRELRAMLAPPSAVILTGAEVAEHFRRLRDGGA